MRIERIAERLVYQNDFFRFFDDDVASADGSSQGRHLRVETTMAGMGVVVLCTDSQSRIAMVRTWRYPIGAYQWSLPRGFSHSVHPEESAQAELREELGVAVNSLRMLGTITPDSGLLAGRVAVFLASATNDALVPEDEQEVDSAQWMALDDVWAAIADGQIEDSFTLSALAMAQAQHCFG